MYTRATSLPSPYIRNIIPDAMESMIYMHLALSGWGYALLQAGVRTKAPG